MSDPCYKDITCPYCGYISNEPTAWIDDSRCPRCEKWMIHKEHNLSKGQRIMQGVFVKYLTTDDDNANGERTGGFGSTGEV